ncbi:hypothetical protein Ait01nite_098590 [Actinoplanes italicus]|jgi:hypothetical protein|uniref:Uncharacterized protein n=2 Tax=Actinoplanes italicus TaxID=113567 RepID=A0A2T0JEE6_9ACTN|nr:hypothetical protein CLV67_14447 [Actinoplanes italicus]GIE36814.1 hypothetical protein Ait01nite_098590 [Actinoplanes italicus]
MSKTCYIIVSFVIAVLLAIIAGLLAALLGLPAWGIVTASGATFIAFLTLAIMAYPFFQLGPPSVP